MNWKYCEDRNTGKISWRAHGKINGHLVELSLTDEYEDWEDGVVWTVKSDQYGHYFSPPSTYYTLDIARQRAEEVFYDLKKTWQDKEYYEC